MTRYLIALPLVMASLTSMTACGRVGAEVADDVEPVAVRVARIDVERIEQPITGTGVLGPKEEVTLSFKVGGVVSRLLVDEGQTVRAGDLLATLELSEIDAAVARARSGAAKAERDLARVRRLHADSVATLEQVQNAETSAEIARAELETATFNRRYAQIVAPANGTILRRTAEPGELVAPGTPIVTLGSEARGVVLRVGLPDRDAVRVRRGQRAVVRLDAFPDRVFNGTVTEVATGADPGTGTFQVEVALPAARGLSSGLVGNVEIRPAATRAVQLIPVEAILEADREQGTVFVLSADGTRAERRRVAIAFVIGDRVAVLDGLDGATHVITHGAAYLDDGQAVTVGAQP